MKRFLITPVLVMIIAAGTAIMAQEYPDEYLGLPGDNFNLYAVMRLFQESETLEGFERSLNDENTRINNLDLNGDNKIDYVKVMDYVDGSVHTIVLQALLGRNEAQDVAVFTVQRFNDGSVQIQLTGDEALYGRNYIIEPIFDETPNPGYMGRANNQNVTVVRTTTVQIAAWPLVRFIYMPSYRVWRSSWYWGYYPTYWHPWRPFFWDYYYGYHYHWYPTYYSHFRRWDNHRYARWNDFYYNNHRTWSHSVTARIDRGAYRKTYSHPEQRRAGEALYVKNNPGRTTRPSVVSTGNSGNRRTVSQSPTTRQSTGNVSSSSRRSSTTVTNRSNNNTSVNNSTSTTRRTTTTVTNRSATNRTTSPSGNTNRSSGNVSSSNRSNSSARQNNAAIPRSTTTVNNRANNNSAAGQSTVTNRRSSGSVNQKSSGSSNQRSSTAKPSRQSNSKASTSKSSGRSNKASSSKSSSKSKESGSSSNSRRK